MQRRERTQSQPLKTKTGLRKTWVLHVSALEVLGVLQHSPFCTQKTKLIVEADHPPKKREGNSCFFGESPASILFSRCRKINREIDF